MRKSHFFVASLIFFIEFSIIAFLALKIYKKTTSVLGAAPVIPLNNGSFSQILTSDLSNFYELNPNQNGGIGANPKWLSNTPIYSINSAGFNNESEFATDKPKNTYRIAAHGDSYTFGLYVDTHNSYPSQLENYLNADFECKNYNNFEVINFGVPGYDIRYALERYKNRAPAYNIDLNIILLMDGDFEDINDITRPIAESYIKDSEAKNEYNYKKAEEVWSKSVKGAITTIGEKKIFDYQLQALKNLAEESQGKLLLVNLPNTKDIYKNAMKELSQTKENVFYLETDDIFKSKLIFPDGHPNVRGHNLIALNIFNFITKNHLVPCN